MSIYGLGDDLGERNLVHGDCLDGDGINVQGRTGGGGVGVRLD